MSDDTQRALSCGRHPAALLESIRDLSSRTCPMPEWQDAKDGILAEILRNGEKFLPGQLIFGAPFDLRTVVVGGIFAASAAAIASGVVATSATLDFAVLVAGLITASLLLVASSLCLFTACPQGLFLPGTQATWRADIEDANQLAIVQRDVLEDMRRKNNKILERLAIIFRWGATVGVLAPFAGYLGWIIF